MISLRTLIGLLPGVCLGIQLACAGDELSFDPALLGLPAEEAAQVDLSYFAGQGGLMPGFYPVSIRVNDELVAHENLQFVPATDAPRTLRACLTAEQLRGWGIRVDDQAPDAPGTGCSLGTHVGSMVAGSTESLDINAWSLAISVPQIQMARSPWLRTPPSQWDHGMPALLLNYSVNGASQDTAGRHYDSRFLRFNSSLNLLGWRLRNDSSLQQGTARKDNWTSLNTYAARSYSALQGGELTLGETGTDSALFESVPFTGAQVVSDDGMLTPTKASFAPVISGIATSPSVVTIRQNGNVIHQQNVQAGPFRLEDIPPGLGSGDMQVEIRGADNQVQRYTQPLASVPQLLRSGRVRYSLAAGQYRRSGAGQGPTPGFVQGTLGWGLEHGTTLYGGSQLAENYRSIMLGAGQYAPSLGAFSLDATLARSDFSHAGGEPDSQRGEAYRVQYARAFEPTATTFNVASYQYAGKGFYNFGEVQERQRAWPGRSAASLYHKRSQVQASVSQKLGGFGSLSLSGSRIRYWSRNHVGQHLQANYSRSFSGVSVGVSAAANRSPRDGDTRTQITLNLSVPLSRLLGERSNGSVNAFTSKNDERLHQQVGVSGSLLEGRNLSYAVSQGVGNQGRDYSGDASLNYVGSYGSVDAGYSYRNDSRLVTYGVRGGLLASEHGVVLSQPLSFGAGNALVRAPGAAGVSLGRSTGASTDWRGYTVASGLTPFQKNVVSLDVDQLPDDVELKATEKRLVPTRGAVVLANFETFRGRKVLASLVYRGQAVPFGAMVVADSDGVSQSGIVGDGGQAYIVSAGNGGVILARWGTRTDQQCVAPYQLPDSDVLVHELSAVCE